MSEVDTKIPAPGELNRIVKLVIDSGDAATIEEAEQLLGRYAVRVTYGAGVSSHAAAQAALLTLIVTGKRALPGGIYLDGELNVDLVVPIAGCRLLAEAAKALGAKIGERVPAGIPYVHIGDEAVSAGDGSIALRCVFDGWRAGVAPVDEGAITDHSSDFALSGVLSGALAMSEVFQHLRGGFAQAGRRVVGLSLWNPSLQNGWMDSKADEPPLELLPSDLWLIGLGHLGQAYLWTLGLLPYKKPQDLRLVLQDHDWLDLANESTSVLTSANMRGTPKTRAMAVWAERRGFRTALIERPFGANIRIQDGDPVLALCGVDNAIARAALEDVGFQWIIDAGLGAGVSEFLAMRMYSFPGPRSARQIWGKASKVPKALPLNQKAYRALRDAGLDECGLTLLAERTVGAPFVGVLASSIVIAEILRVLHGGRRITAMDATLRALDERIVVMNESGHLPNPGFCLAKRGV